MVSLEAIHQIKGNRADATLAHQGITNAHDGNDVQTGAGDKELTEVGEVRQIQRGLSHAITSIEGQPDGDVAGDA